MSNAADRSIRVSNARSQESSAERMLDITFNMAVSVEWCARYTLTDSLEVDGEP